MAVWAGLSEAALLASADLTRVSAVGCPLGWFTWQCGRVPRKQTEAFTSLEALHQTLHNIISIPSSQPEKVTGQPRLKGGEINSTSAGQEQRNPIAKEQGYREK